ncbi:MAG: hypothetical protein FJW34_24925 [Acidobacteria bacterium]|nr:hypothetical protein [Acidobacteriota bacterium]
MDQFSGAPSVEGIDADGVIVGGEFLLNVVDREVALTQSDDQFPDRVAGGGSVGTGLGLEEGRAFGGVVAELMTQDTETAWGVAEATGRFGGREMLNEVGAESFVLAMERLFGGEEEGGGLGLR